MTYKYNIQTMLSQLKKGMTSALAMMGVSVLGLGLAIGLFPAIASAAPSVIYNNIPSPIPGNVPSEAFQATQTSEFGGQVQFSGTNRYNPLVNVLMSSWGC